MAQSAFFIHITQSGNGIHPFLRLLFYTHFTERGGGVANEKNLVPFSERSESEARENGRKGGIASGKARRRNKSLKEAADYFLSLPVSDQRSWNKLARKGI